MKKSIQEVGTGSDFAEPEDMTPGKSKWSGRMGWKSEKTPGSIPPAQDFVEDPEMGDATISPEAQGVVPIGKAPSNRFNWSPTPGAKGKLGAPGMGKEMTRADIDTIMAEIQKEKALPPHKQNAAKIARLKDEALRMMSQEESQWVQRSADKLLPLAG